MTEQTIQTVLVVGAGTMGAQIALQCASHGMQVHLYDVSDEILTGARRRIEASAKDVSEASELDHNLVRKSIEKIRYSTEPETVAAVDLLTESVPENLELKRDVLARFHTCCPPRTLFTTNTSSFVPSMLAEASGRPSQFAALHFHLPVWQSNVVDVMPHPGTDPEVIPTLVAFARAIGQTPIVLEKENYGYVFNAMYNALNREALTLAANGVASIEDIDRAWMGVMKTPAGPFGMLDQVGLETVWTITHYWAQVLGDAQLQTNADFVKGYLEKGRLGVRSGAGFYTYPDPAFAAPDFLGR